MEDYIVVSKKWLEEKIQKNKIFQANVNDAATFNIYSNRVGSFNDVLEHSKSLQPIIEDAFDAGSRYTRYCIRGKILFGLDSAHPFNKKEYIENLKIE